MTGNLSNNAVFNWDFGQFSNPQTSSLSAPQNVNFTSTGIHVVTLTVTDGTCSSPAYTDSIEIFEMPIANFTGDNVEGCPPLNVDFQNLSSDYGNQTYQWNFGNGNTESGFDPDYSYEESGNFSVTLTVTTENGCVAEYISHSMITVYPEPQAGFNVNPNVLTTAQPMANIIDESSGAISWFYSLGDGDTSYQRNLTHNYYEPGDYTLSQRVVNQFGCVDVATYQLKVEPIITFYLPNAFTPDGDGNNEIFKCYGLNIVEFRMEIYTRWGELVFESNDIDLGWNGKKFNEKDRVMSQQDVYAVVVYVRDTFDLPPKRIDHRVTLVRYDYQHL
jgi:gliding motility-associated-like protein